jgi:tRNA dimethylallyltransferase
MVPLPTPPRLADVVTPGRHVALVGTTASGKSDLALALARVATPPGSIELVSVDSMQVYRGMDIGTAKPSPAERAEIRHHLIDLVDPDQEYTVARFASDVRAALADVEARGKQAVLVGGTGLYLRAAVEDLDLPGQFPAVRVELEHEDDTGALHRRLAQLDPVAATRMEPTNRRRVVRALEVTIGSGRPFSSFGSGLTDYPPSPIRIVGVRLARPVVDRRIEARYAAQLAAGFVDEVRALAARPNGMSRTACQALGYRELLGHVEHGVPLADAVDEAITRTRRFARRQERWFRRDPRITWFAPPEAEADQPASVLPALRAFLADPPAVTGRRAGS